MSLVLVRHGQSVWNMENRFTGWVDVDLTDLGRAEAKNAGTIIKNNNIIPNSVFVSPLKRARETCNIILRELNTDIIPTESPEMIERFYGGLTGLNKDETTAKYGTDQVHVWRRSYTAAPPAINNENQHHPKHNKLFANFPFALPNTESLKDVVARVDIFYRNILLPLLENNKTVIIVAHGNSLRALIKLMIGLSDTEIEKIEIPTGQPIFINKDPQKKWTYKISTN